MTQICFFHGITRISVRLHSLMGARTLFTSISPVHHNIVKTLLSKLMNERLKLPGVTEKETQNKQQACLGVYKRSVDRPGEGGREGTSNF